MAAVRRMIFRLIVPAVILVLFRSVSILHIGREPMVVAMMLIGLPLFTLL